MSELIIMSDSSCDIPDSVIKEYNIKLIPYYVSFDQKNYYKERIELSIKDFYEKLRKENVFPKTSLPSVDDYMNAFTPLI
ncbi:MAG TPA: DegV family protein, partial [Defluviitaleaceae bacterium]|nr:DegV family protein [Defluviitaleaceae bacterium]